MANGYTLVAQTLASLGVRLMYGVIGIPVTELASAAQVCHNYLPPYRPCDPHVLDICSFNTLCVSVLPRMVSYLQVSAVLQLRLCGVGTFILLLLIAVLV